MLLHSTSILLVVTMYLPFRLLATELRRKNSWKIYLDYQRSIAKVENNNLRIKFLENCLQSDLIPRFLKFRVPKNDCFDNKSVHDFQRKLLKKEWIKAKDNNKICVERLDKLRSELVMRVPEKCIPSVVLYSTYFRRQLRSKLSKRHADKLNTLAQEQQRPLFQVKDTVVLHNIDTTPPAYVMATLALGPKNSVLDKFKPHDVLAELDDLLAYCKNNHVSEETISDINIKTLGYIKKCKKLKSSRNIQMTKRYLMDNNLLAVPFDKGVGICLMKKEDYCSKLNDILQLPQFQRVEKGRKNEKSPLLKEEERIVEALKSLRDEGKIQKSLYKKLKPRGSQPARLYGTAKVHKTIVPLRPVLLMPGSSYFKIGDQ